MNNKTKLEISCESSFVSVRLHTIFATEQSMFLSRVYCPSGLQSLTSLYQLAVCSDCVAWNNAAFSDVRFLFCSSLCLRLKFRFFFVFRFLFFASISKSILVLLIVWQPTHFDEDVWILNSRVDKIHIYQTQTQNILIHTHTAIQIIQGKMIMKSHTRAHTHLHVPSCRTRNKFTMQVESMDSFLRNFLSREK